MSHRASLEAFVAEQQADEQAALRRENGYERLWREITRDAIELLAQRVAAQSRQALALLDLHRLERP